MNQTLPYHALPMLAQLFRYGRLSYHGGFVNLRAGRATALPVDPVIWPTDEGAVIKIQTHKDTLRK